MKKINFIITIIVGLIAFILGYSFNYILGQKTAECPQPEKPLAKYLDSGVVQDISILLGGQVVEISGYNLTLSKDGKTFTILINENTKLSRLVPPEEEDKTPIKKDIKFEEIKVGDIVTAAGKLNTDASSEINSVTVLPSWY